MRIIKAGVLDDISVINATKPGAELYAPDRVEWVAAIEGAKQNKAVSDVLVGDGVRGLTSNLDGVSAPTCDSLCEHSRLKSKTIAV